MKLFGHPASTCTRKVLFTLHETNTPYTLELVDFAKGEHKAPAHMARQPFGQLPAFDDNGFALYESRAMARYIDAKAGYKVTPQDLQTRAVMEQFISVETSNFTPHAMKFIYHHTFGRAQTPEVLEAAGKMLDTCYGVLDKQVATRTFLAGDHLSIADICFAPYIEYMAGSPAKDILAGHKHAQAWWTRVSERPAWLKTVGRA